MQRSRTLLAGKIEGNYGITMTVLTVLLIIYFTGHTYTNLGAKTTKKTNRKCRWPPKIAMVMKMVNICFTVQYFLSQVIEFRSPSVRLRLHTHQLPTLWPALGLNPHLGKAAGQLPTLWPSLGLNPHLGKAAGQLPTLWPSLGLNPHLGKATGQLTSVTCPCTVLNPHLGTVGGKSTNNSVTCPATQLLLG